MLRCFEVAAFCGCDGGSVYLFGNIYIYIYFFYFRIGLGINFTFEVNGNQENF